MSSHTPNHDQPAEPNDPTEARMRAALGLGARPAAPHGGAGPASPPPASHDATRQRRRFAQDGDVPVVILHRGRDGDTGGENRLAALTSELREERAARQKAERALEESQGLVSSLRTKLKHAEMTLEDKLQAESEARLQFDQLLAQERDARQRAETRAAEAELVLSLRDRQAETAEAAPRRAAAPKRDLFDEVVTGEDAPATRRRGRKPKVAAETAPEPEPALAAADADADGDGDGEDKPIEWWLPSFRAARKAPPRRKRTTG